MHVRPGSLGFTLLLGALAALPALSIDISLPALPTMAEDLYATSRAAGLTLSLFMIGYGIAQATMGALSDRLGRRPVLLAGMVLYTLSGLGAALAPNIAVLVALRLLQGIGAATGPVLVYAIIRDLFDATAGRARISYVTIVLGVAPIVAPSLGGWLLVTLGWRAIFLALAASGVLLTFAVALMLPESRRRTGMDAGLVANYRRVLGDRRSLGYALVNACTFGAIFAFIAGSPLVLIDTMQVSTHAFALLFSLAAAGVMAGGWINGSLANRGVPPMVPLWSGLVLSLAAATIPSVLALAGELGPVPLMVFMLAVTTCRGLINPNAVMGAMERGPDIAGSVSSVIGFLQSLLAALGGALVSLLHPAFGALAMTGVMMAFAVISIGIMVRTTGWPRLGRAG